jgi:hypothetical protein
VELPVDRESVRYRFGVDISDSGPLGPKHVEHIVQHILDERLKDLAALEAPFVVKCHEMEYDHGAKRGLAVSITGYRSKV